MRYDCADNFFPTALPVDTSPWPADPAWLDWLEQVWRGDGRGWFAKRRAIGVALNTRINLPYVRARRGARKVLADVSGRLGVAVAELQRMRWLAYHYRTLKEVRATRPGVNSWEALKKADARLGVKTGRRRPRKAASQRAASGPSGGVR
jgi:hypothetical protein